VSPARAHRPAAARRRPHPPRVAAPFASLLALPLLVFMLEAALLPATLAAGAAGTDAADSAPAEPASAQRKRRLESEQHELRRRWAQDGAAA